MKEPKFFRKDKVIRTPEGDEAFPSVNTAKRRSRELQLANGGLGCGVLRVVEKLPSKLVVEAKAAP